jgi:hypothetical protein
MARWAGGDRDEEGLSGGRCPLVSNGGTRLSWPTCWLTELAREEWRGHFCRRRSDFTRIIFGGESNYISRGWRNHSDSDLLRTPEQQLTKALVFSGTIALSMWSKMVVTHSLRFTLVLLLFSSTISRSSSCKVSRAFSMLAPRRTPHLCCSCHRIRLENSLWYFRSLISRASQTWHLLSTLLI